MTTNLASYPCDTLAAAAALLPKTPDWLKLARSSCLRIPPLWPLQSFVAVNPFVGLVGRSFAEVCALMERVTHESMLMSASCFREQVASGRITSEDLAAALRQSGCKATETQLLEWLDAPQPARMNGLKSVADIADARQGGRWKALVTEEMSKGCAAYYDEGQAAWRMPWKKLPLYAAWRQAAQVDASPELAGLKQFRQFVAALPEEAAEAVTVLLAELQPPAGQVEDYLHRLLMELPGWSSYVQYRVREKAMRGAHDESLLELLAVRLVYEAHLARQFKALNLTAAWQDSFAAAGSGDSEGLRLHLVWHTALEIGFQRQLCRQLVQAGENDPATGQVKASRRALQAIFCIDVRSEVMRRSLESVSPQIETLGFAGFFGMPVQYVPFGQRHGTSQVPVLLTPKYSVREHLPGATAEEEKHARKRLQVGRRVAHSWSAFKTSAVSCFSFVEAAGVGYAWRLVKDGLLHGARQESHTCSSCAAPNLHQHKRLTPDPLEDAHTDPGIPPEDQVQLALGALKNMGLTAGFARLVMICGHGSHTTNNPYAAGLDCGACGGHPGDSNARVAAAILNQPHVRAALHEHGIHIPDDTCFVAALHNTTTDHITIFDADKTPPSHKEDLLRVQLWLAQAARTCRQLRAGGLGLANVQADDLDSLIQQRSHDWAQVRPEWGLAGNAAFIAAPRERTRRLDLKGRVFLHNYDHTKDTAKSTLELIMTAPMVVAHWINMQYYASTVNNRLWGSGNKTTHNVVGTFGIQQGNGGDLQAGLPLQSVHDGAAWRHEPVRLSVFIEAPRPDIDAVIAKHESVRQLVENGWLHLFAIENKGKAIMRRAGSSWITA